MHETLELLKLLDAAETWTNLAGPLHLGAGIPRAAASPSPADRAELPWLAREGLVTLSAAATPETSAAMAAVLGALVRAGYPATFLYAFDEVWALGERLRARASAARR